MPFSAACSPLASFPEPAPCSAATFPPSAFIPPSEVPAEASVAEQAPGLGTAVGKAAGRIAINTGSALGGAGIGAIIGSLFAPGLGTVIGAGIGAALFGGAGEAFSLPVTEEHPLLIERKGAEIWSRAGELADGDLLMGPAGERYRFDRDASRVIRGAFDVYNLSFSSGSTGMVPTYIVSPDGRHWIVAHNIKR